MAILSEQIEQAHRRQLFVDTRRAIALGKSVQDFRTERAAAIEKWTHTIRNMMQEHGVSDPIECLPAIIASVLEKAIVEARDTATIAARNEIKRLLRKAVAP